VLSGGPEGPRVLPVLTSHHAFRCSGRADGSVSVLSGAMISMGRMLEKVGLALYSPECVEGEF
jgi:hypothetical protein